MSIQWNSINTSSITEHQRGNIEYWYNVWAQTCFEIENGFHGIKSINARLVISELIDELELNDSRNNRTSELIRSVIAYLLEKHPIIKDSYKNEFTNLRNQLQEKRFRYSIAISNEICKKFSKDKFGIQVYNLLIASLNNESSTDNDSLIKMLTIDLVWEFLFEDYSIKEIKDFIEDIFSTYTSHILNDGSEYIHTDFIHQFKYVDFQTVNDFNLSLKTYMDNLSINDRLLSFFDLFNLPKNKWFSFFRLNGFKINNADSLMIENAEIYNSKISPKIESNNHESIYDIEFKRPQKKESDNNYSTILIENYSLSPDVALQKSKNDIQRILDILQFRTEKYRILQTSDHYFLTDDKFNIRISGINHDDIKLRQTRAIYNPVTIENETEMAPILKISSIFDSLENEKSQLKNALRKSLSFRNKAINSNTVSDKLLFLWISIESLIPKPNQDIRIFVDNGRNEDKFEIIRDVLPKIFIMIYKEYILQDLFNYVNSRYAESDGKENSYIDFRQDLVEKLKLDTLGSIESSDVITALPLIEELAKDRFTIEKVKFAHDLYSKQKRAGQMLRKIIRDKEQEIDLIYKHRNQITHNAHIDSKLLDQLSKIAEELNWHLIEVVTDGIKDGIKDINDILLRSKVKADVLLINLESNSLKENLFNYK